MHKEKPILSICISRFNEDVSHLLLALCTEVKRLQVPIDIHLRDDCSELLFPINISEPFLFTHKNSSNLGRARNRNRLVNDSTGEFVLFLDGDVMPARRDFIEQYIHALQKNDIDVLTGGITYRAEVPPRDKLLHYRYGLLREAQESADSHLKTSNLCIRRSVIMEVKFDESLRNYGHEDTLLSLKLEHLNYTIEHFHNPIIHEGLMSNKEFIHKQDQALHTLAGLHEKGYNNLTRLQKFYQQSKSSVLLKLIPSQVCINLLRELLLMIPRINLKILDLYKLLVYRKLLSEK